MNHWVDLAPAESLAVGSAKAFRRGGEHVAVFRLAEDRFFAIDNRCPHEGYAMVQGYVQKQTVTCAWHNFKFDLETGQCLMGDEDIRTFPVRCQRGRLEVEVVPPDPRQEQERALRSLEQGILEGRIAQATRDMVRALHFGLEPRQLALELCRIDAVYARYGLGHGTAAAVDALRFQDIFEGPAMALPLLIPARQVAQDRIRLPRRQSHQEISEQDGEVALRAAVEVVDLPRAVGIFSGLWDGNWSKLRHLFFRLCSDHFYSFGHRLIYLVKVDELLAGVQEEDAEFHDVAGVVEGLLVGIVNGTRHDTLPPWRRWMRSCAPYGERLSLWVSNEGADSDRILALAEAWCQPEEEEALDALIRALDAGLTAKQGAEALILAASHRMLSFDVRLDGDPTLQDDWLNVTHCLTTSVAYLQAIERGMAHPVDALRQLFLCARFVWGMHPLDGEAIAMPAPEAMTAEDVLNALAAGQEEKVFAGAQHLLRESGKRFRTSLLNASVRDAGIRPIVAVHLMKTLVAAMDASTALSVGQERPVLAALRFWCHGHREFNSERLVHEAMVNVVDGGIPRTLT